MWSYIKTTTATAPAPAPTISVNKPIACTSTWARTIFLTTSKIYWATTLIKNEQYVLKLCCRIIGTRSLLFVCVFCFPLMCVLESACACVRVILLLLLLLSSSFIVGILWQRDFEIVMYIPLYYCCSRLCSRTLYNFVEPSFVFTSLLKSLTFWII